MEDIVVCKIDPDKEDPALTGFRAGMKFGEKKGIEQGLEVGRFIMLIELVEDGKISLEYASKVAEMTEEKFLEFKHEFDKQIH